MSASLYQGWGVRVLPPLLAPKMGQIKGFFKFWTLWFQKLTYLLKLYNLSVFLYNFQEILKMFKLFCKLLTCVKHLSDTYFDSNYFTFVSCLRPLCPPQPMMPKGPSFHYAFCLTIEPNKNMESFIFNKVHCPPNMLLLPLPGLGL